MANIDKGFEIELLALEGESKTSRTLITTGSNDPSTGAGELAPVGSLFLRQVSPTQGEIYLKVGTSDVDWNIISTNADIQPILDIYAATKEPTGHKDRSESQISFDEVTRTFTIQPIGVSFDYYIHGAKHTITTTKTVVVPNVQGMHFIYFDTAENLNVLSGVFSSVILTDYAYVAGLYWDVGSQRAPYVAEERHGITMDGATHAHFHSAFGTRFISGLALNNVSVDISTPANIDAQIGVDNGAIRDEDILLTILHDPTGANPLTTNLEQILSPPAQIPVLYREGANGDWKIKTADDYPIIYSGTAGYIDVNYGLPAWNEWTGSTWTLTPVANNDYVLVHIFATNDIRHPIIAIQGIVDYQNKPIGLVNAHEEIALLSGLPFQEVVPIATLIWECRSIYTNITKSRLRSTDVGNDYVDLRLQGSYFNVVNAGVYDHGNLSGLVDDDHVQYVPTVGTTRPTISINSPPSINDILRFDGTNWTASAAENNKTLSTGLLTGGAISINISNNTKFDVSAGVGLIVDNYTNPENPTYQVITWPAQIGVQSLYYNTAQRSFIAIDASGSVIQKNSKYTSQEHRDNIVLGLLGHTTLTSIINVRHTPNAVFDPTARLTDLANGIGAFNISGNIYSPNGSNLKLNKTSGLIHKIGTNFQTDKKSPDIDESAAETISQFRYSYRNGAGGFVVGSTVTDINPNVWDNDSGTLQTVSANNWTIQLVKYMSGSLSGTPTARIEVGQTTYPSKEAALSILPTPNHEHNPAFVDGTLRCYLVVKAGATDLTDTNQAIFYEVEKFYDTLNNPKVFATLQFAYENSINPEITTDTSRGAISIKEGSGVGGNLLEGYDDTDAQVFGIDVSGNITPVGLVDGRDVSVDGTTLDNLVTEVNAIESSVGSIVNSSGVWVGFSGTNSLDPSTNITNALTILDSNIYSPFVHRHNGVLSQTFTAPTALLLNTSVREDGVFTYNAGIITVSLASWYRIIVNITLANTTNNRVTSESYLTLNGSEIVGTKAFGYHRDINSGNTTVCIAGNIQLAMGNQVSVVSRRFSGTGTLQTVQNACRITIQRVI